jgi:hypothetical protein
MVAELVPDKERYFRCERPALSPEGRSLLFSATGNRLCDREGSLQRQTALPI